MLFTKKIHWVIAVMLLCGILLNNLPIAHADFSSVLGKEAIYQTSGEIIDINATVTDEPSIADDRRDGYYLESDETDEFGNGINYFSKTSYFPLYAMMKSENIYLYGIGNDGNYHSGMIFFKDGQGTYFDWPNLTYYSFMPELSYFDYDGDGEKEIAVVIYSNKGTGLLDTELHILKPELDELGHISYKEHTLKTENIAQWFSEGFTTKLSEDNGELTISFAGHDYHVDIQTAVYGVYEEAGWHNLQGVGYGSSNEFYFAQNDAIKISIGIGFNFKNWPIKGNYLGNVTAKVNYDGERFFLSDYTLHMNEPD